MGMAKAIAKRAPTIVLRPAAGVMKATSNALQGVGNALDPQSRRRIDDVSAQSLLFYMRRMTNYNSEIQILAGSNKYSIVPRERIETGRIIQLDRASTLFHSNCGIWKLFDIVLSCTFHRRYL